MTVEVSYSGMKNGLSKSETTTLLGELIDVHGSTSSTSGTYSVEHSNYVADSQRFVIEVQLTDADDSDYPNVKDDLAGTIANLSVDFGTKSDVKSELDGNLS